MKNNSDRVKIVLDSVGRICYITYMENENNNGGLGVCECGSLTDIDTDTNFEKCLSEECGKTYFVEFDTDTVDLSGYAPRY